MQGRTTTILLGVHQAEILLLRGVHQANILEYIFLAFSSRILSSFSALKKRQERVREQQRQEASLLMQERQGVAIYPSRVS
jgi:hypothetical protein